MDQRPDQIIDVLDAVYAAALDTEGWPNALQKISDLFGGVGSVLIPLVDGGACLPLASRDLEAPITALAEGWWRQDLRLARWRERGMPRLLTDQTLVTPDEMAHHPFYAEFLAGYGLKWMMGGVMDATLPPREIAWLNGGPAGRGQPDLVCDRVALSVDRSSLAGPFSQTDLRLFRLLVGHVERALTIQDRLLEKTSNDHSELQDWLEQLSSGMALVNSSGRVIWLNSAARGMLGDGLTITHGELRASLSADQAALDRALQNAYSLLQQPQLTSGPVVIRRPSNKRSFIVHILPPTDILRSRIGHAAAHLVLLKILDLEVESPPPLALVQSAFGLSASEARVASAVGMGNSPREAASRLGLTEGTVRVTLKRVFDKIGISRQSELTVLIVHLAAKQPFEKTPRR